MARAIIDVMQRPARAQARAKRSLQQLIGAGLTTDRMVSDFTVLLGAVLCDADAPKVYAPPA